MVDFNSGETVFQFGEFTKSIQPQGGHSRANQQSGRACFAGVSLVFHGVVAVPAQWIVANTKST